MSFHTDLFPELDSIWSYTASTTAMSPATPDDAVILRCSRCAKTLNPYQDRQKTTTKYWKSCLECREKETRRRRDKKNARLAALIPETRKDVSAARKKKPRRGTDGTADRSSTITARRPKENRVNLFDQRIESSARFWGTASYTPLLVDPASSQLKEPECSVCGDTFAADQFPHLQTCSHEPRVCSDCFASWLSSQVGSTSWDRIVCPSDGCGVLVTHADMTNLATQDTYKRFDELSTRSVLSAMPDYRPCLNPQCTSGYFHDSAAQENIVTCDACSFKVCTTHNEAAYIGETCEDYDKRKSCERKVEDDASLEMIQGTTKQCPGESCGVRIEKNNGCDHMTCRYCRHEFCWLCLALYRGKKGIDRAGNVAHQRHCKWYRSN